MSVRIPNLISRSSVRLSPPGFSPARQNVSSPSSQEEGGEQNGWKSWGGVQFSPTNGWRVAGSERVIDGVGDETVRET